METVHAYIPDDFYSILVMGAVALVAIWLVLFIVRKLIGFALVTALVIGGLMVWHNPDMLRTAQETASGYYDQWRYGSTVHEDQQRW